MENNNKKALIEYLITSWNYTEEEAVTAINDAVDNNYYNEYFGDFLLDIVIDGKNLYVWTDIDNLYAVEEEILLQYLKDLPKLYNTFESEIRDHLLYNVDSLIEEISFNKSIIKEWIEEELHTGSEELGQYELETIDGFIYE